MMDIVDRQIHVIFFTSLHIVCQLWIYFDISYKATTVLSRFNWTSFRLSSAAPLGCNCDRCYFKGSMFRLIGPISIWKANFYRLAGWISCEVIYTANHLARLGSYLLPNLPCKTPCTSFYIFGNQLANNTPSPTCAVTPKSSTDVGTVDIRFGSGVTRMRRLISAALQISLLWNFGTWTSTLVILSTNLGWCCSTD